MTLLLQGIADYQAGRRSRFPGVLAEAFGRVLADGRNDPAFAAEVLALPLEVYIAEQMPVIDPDAIHHARLVMRRFLAKRLQLL